MPPKTIGVNEAPRRFHDFTIASGIVFTFAMATVLFLPSSKMSHAPHEPMPLVLALPHLSIVALMAAGFRRSGDIVAWILAMPCLFIFAFLAFLSGLGGESNGDVALVKIAFFQLIIVLAAGADLARNKKLTPQPVALRNRWIGFVVPVVVLLATSALANGGVRKRENQIQSTEDSTHVEAKSQAAAWLNDPMIDDVVRIARCIEQFRGDSIAGRAPKSLQEAHCADSIGHHLVYYAPPKNPRGDPFHRAAFTLGIEAVWDSAEFPDAIGRLGTRNYFLDANAEIHVTAEHRRATVADPVVPACPRHNGEIPYHVECRPPFESRERWGVVHDLPRFSIHVDHFDSRDSVLASFYFHQVSALDSVRLVSIDWGEGHAPTVMNIKPTQSITSIEVIGDTAAYTHEFQPSMFYRYSTWGHKVVTAKLVTRAGAEYIATDTVNVAGLRPKSQ